MSNSNSGMAQGAGNTSQVVADLYARFLNDASSVEPNWQALFRDLDEEAKGLLASLSNGQAAANGETQVAAAVAGDADISASDVRQATLDSIRALMLIRAYRVRGHLEARLDPLGLAKIDPHPELDPRTYGFEEADMDRPIFINNVLGFETATPRQIMQRVRETYCGSIGVEYMHIQDPAQKAWIQERIEGHNWTDFTITGRRTILERLTAAEVFEKFLDKKYTGTKRFGLDGGESLIPALEQILKRGSQLGLEEVVIGMPHRGRLNVLANFMGKPFTAIFSEFQGGASSPEDIGGSGDVKYHLGTSSDREFEGKVVHLSLTANPSHLEAVDPVVIGKVRAKQIQRKDSRNRTKVMALLMHGDAAFSGQGLVPETLDLSELKGYRTGGTIHFIVNNQIGFTTNPVNSRSGPYCSDVAKLIQAPILHVNGDNPEAVVHVARIATEFRQTFNKDVIIDMFCYRRHGHNESDEPAFTQPLMYRKIAQHPTTRQIYGEKLVSLGVLNQGEVDGILAQWQQRLDADFTAAKSYKPNKADWLEGAWSGLDAARGYGARRGKTGLPVKVLKEVGAALTRVPEGFNAHRKILRQLASKKKLIDGGEGIDWATAEALAFGSLLIEGSPVRLSGQDCNRGTFSQRHACIIDQQDESRYMPLNGIREKQETIEIVDSPLSEVAVLGFEYGYSLAEPRALVLWEAQFGDFANGAQIIIDQFITSGESKWLRMSGLVMLLPHGYEGQGPEHSSARLERFLQLCAEDNIQVANCTTPANYFHVLRRQMHRKFRKPLIIMTPKSLLRHKRAVSPLKMFQTGTEFHRVLYCDERPSDPKDAKQVVLCTGKVYYDLLEERDKRDAKDVHFLRLEQIYPFPADALFKELERYKHCHLVWCQEEPRNMGAWGFVASFIEEVAEDVGCKYPRPRYAGRISAASPATGSNARHRMEQAELVDDAMTVGKKALSRIEARKALAEKRAKQGLA